MEWVVAGQGVCLWTRRRIRIVSFLDTSERKTCSWALHLQIALLSVSLQCDGKNGCDDNYGTGCVVLYSLYNFGL